MEYAIETVDLNKNYGRKYAVNNVSIHVKKGEIYGLIGKNGAGKTTLMKAVLGMINTKSGKVIINGEEKNLNLERKKIGSLIEAPGLFGNCSAYGNLRRFSILYGADKEQIPELLHFVGLDTVGSKRASKFSLGMKQRLGIAIALLNNPEILVLDEPVNGLDPEGIKDVRDVLLKLKKEKNVTVFISSHLIDELSKIVDVYGIMNNGILVEEVTKEEIDKEITTYISLKSSNNEEAMETIKQELQLDCRIVNDEIRIIGTNIEINRIGEVLMQKGIFLLEIKSKTKGYEEYFIERLGE